MKKSLVYFILLFLATPVSLLAQQENQIFKDTKTGNDIYVGAVTRDGLINIGTWFNEEYALYKTDSTATGYLAENRDKLPDVFIVLGTWCGDSKEHVPHFFKIADEIKYPQEKIFMVAVDRDKKGGEFCLADFEINLVPTFIFTKRGQEIGRIIETPVTTLEQDLVTFIQGIK